MLYSTIVHLSALMAKWDNTFTLVTLMWETMGTYNHIAVKYDLNDAHKPYELSSSNSFINRTFILERISVVQNILDTFGDFNKHSTRNLIEMSKDATDVRLQRRVKQYLHLLGQMKDAQLTLSVLNIRISDSSILAESAFSGVMMENVITDESKEENFIDAVGDSIKFVSAGDSANSAQGQTNILNMSDYLSRPVEIHVADISTADISLILPVWDLFTKHPSVRAKVRNFAYLRGNLHVRIAISGTPFHFGRVLVSYQPFATYNQNLINQASMYIASTGASRPLFLNYLSQAPGASIMNVNENLPLEITCPFISTKPMHRLFNSATTAISAATSFDDMADAGDLYVYTLNSVGSVGTTPADVTMQIYAWMTDVELGTNTATLLEITTESDFSDEREKGPVEKIASAALNVANALRTVPIIGLYAKASSIVLSAVKNTAALFGWSKPILIQHTQYVKNLPFTNGAQTIGDDTNFRVTLDPKQELTVDPRVIGSDQDDMTIASMASRLSFLQTFQWAGDDVTMATPLFIGRINPCLVTFITDVTKNYIQPTALAYSAAPFSYWRGDIVFRFEIVCSQYHRGKLAIFYEPNASQMTLINADLSFNKQFIRVIDIQQTQTFEVSVKWAAYRAWLRVNNAAAAVLNTSLSYSGTENQGFCNGYIGIVPFTSLTSPSSSPVVDINVYVRSDNIQYNGLTTANLPTERIVPDIEEIKAESNFADTTSADLRSTQSSSISTKDVSMLPLNDSSASTLHICEEHFGEQPISFRSLLKRYVTHAAYQLTTTTAGIRYLSFVGNIYPNINLLYGGTSVTYNDLYSYLRYAYLGMRGSTRFRIRPVGTTGVTEFMQAKLALLPPSNAITEVVSWDTSGVGSPANLSGAVSFVPHTNGGFEAEFPFYSNNLWVFSFVDGLTGGTSTDNMSAYWFRQFRFTADFASGGTISAQAIMTEFATGEDFCFLRFQGSPFYSADPVA